MILIVISKRLGYVLKSLQLFLMEWYIFNLDFSIRHFKMQCIVYSKLINYYKYIINYLSYLYKENKFTLTNLFNKNLLSLINFI